MSIVQGYKDSNKLICISILYLYFYLNHYKNNYTLSGWIYGVAKITHNVCPFKQLQTI